MVIFGWFYLRWCENALGNTTNTLCEKRRKWAASWQNQQNGMCAQRRQISLGICPVWSESSLSAWRKLGSLANHWAHSEDADQTGRIPRLIWVFTGRKGHFIAFVMRRLKYFLISIVYFALLFIWLKFTIICKNFIFANIREIDHLWIQNSCKISAYRVYIGKNLTLQI